MFANLLRGLFALLIAAPAWAGPPIQHWETGNGARVLFVEARDLPMLDVRVSFDAGSARDGEIHGLASLTADLLDQGIVLEGGEKDAQAVAEAFENIGARFGASVTQDAVTLSLRSLIDPARLDPALATFTAVMAQPRLAEDDFTRERERVLLGLKAGEQQPGEVARRAFYKALYGAHPYAFPPEGEADNVKAMTAGQVRDFHKRHYVAAGMVIVLAGDLGREQAERLAERLASALPRGEALPALPPVPELREGKTLRIPFPSTQATIMAGQPGMARIDPDYFPLYVGNHVLGGSGFSSRLMEEIREKRGLAYSVYSQLMPMAVPGPFLMGMQTRLDQAAQSERLLRENLERFVKDGPTEAELDHAKKNIVGGFPLRLDSNKDIADWLSVMGVYRLPLDFLDRYPEQVKATSVASIRDAWQRRIHPDRLVMVIVGGKE
ncbi:MAG: insulinase family protein [Halothiobacillaceae bacterium]|nr:MAG: insulinase family protein [Halothiobacillaceae bacterium]